MTNVRSCYLLQLQIIILVNAKLEIKVKSRQSRLPTCTSDTRNIQIFKTKIVKIVLLRRRPSLGLTRHRYTLSVRVGRLILISHCDPLSISIR